jgi:Sortase domain
VTAPVVPIGVHADGTLALPDSPRTVGWWIGSAPAGDPRDGTLVAGHVDTAREGLGALAALHALQPGASIVLTDAFGVRHRYAMTARRTYPKYALPQTVFRVDGHPGLTLVTCGGPFDARTRQYRDNIVVYAALTG